MLFAPDTIAMHQHSSAQHTGYVCVHVWGCKCAYVHVYMCVETRGLPLSPLTLFLRWGSLTKSKLTNFTRLAGQRVSEIPLSRPLCAQQASYRLSISQTNSARFMSSNSVNKGKLQSCICHLARSAMGKGIISMLKI